MKNMKHFKTQAMMESLCDSVLPINCHSESESQFSTQQT